MSTQIVKKCDNLRSGSEDSGSGCVKVFSEPGFIVAGNGNTRGYFGWALVYKALLHCQSAVHSGSSKREDLKQRYTFKYTVTSILVLSD